MKWTHRFQVDAPVGAIFEAVAAPDKSWATFYYAYRGLESADANWPEKGSSAVFRFGLGPWTVKVKQTIVEHEHGRRIRVHEEAFSGLWIDNIEFHLDPEDGGTNCTLILNQTSKAILVRLLVFLRWPLNWLTVPPAVKRFKAMIEGSKSP